MNKLSFIKRSGILFAITFIALFQQGCQSTTEEDLYLRRQTLIVRDIDKSLALYRDAIGMEVIYDQMIVRPHKTEERMQEIRLVLLKATDDFIGVLGLVDYEAGNPNHSCLLYTSPSPRDQRGSRMPSSA